MFLNGSPGVSVVKGITVGGGGVTAVVGGAYKFTTILGGGFPFLYFGYLSAGNLFLQRETDGALSIYRDDAASVLLVSSAPGVINLGVYYYIEFKATIDPAAGSASVRVNGTQVASVAGVDTTGNLTIGTGFSYFMLKAAASSGFYVDDIYALDTAGASNNDFLGDTRIEYLHPDGPGAEQAWDVVGAASHWQAVYDQTAVDDDTTYIHTATVGLTDTETFSNTGLPSGTIYAVQLSPYVRKTDAGARQIAPVVRHAAVDYIGTPVSPSSGSYNYFPQVYQTNPGTGAAWTISDVNGAEFGVKLTT
jgi:hypothetical protein